MHCRLLWKWVFLLIHINGMKYIFFPAIFLFNFSRQFFPNNIIHNDICARNVFIGWNTRLYQINPFHGKKQTPLRIEKDQFSDKYKTSNKFNVLK